MVEHKGGWVFVDLTITRVQFEFRYLNLYISDFIFVKYG